MINRGWPGRLFERLQQRILRGIFSVSASSIIAIRIEPRAGESEPYNQFADLLDQNVGATGRFEI